MGVLPGPTDEEMDRQADLDRLAALFGTIVGYRPESFGPRL
jgi:hypothetical protein